MRHPRHLIPTRVVLVALALAATLLVANSVQADQPTVFAEYVVQPGDTLWHIARGIEVDGGDVRQTVSTVRQINGLAGSTIHPGQTLLLPAG